MNSSAEQPHAPSAAHVRDPIEEGECECGTFTAEANEMALVTSSTSHLYDQVVKLAEQWQAAMKAVTAEKIFLKPKEFRTESLRWILSNAGKVYQAALQECNRGRDEPLNMTPDAQRDFFCWLHRYFVYLKQEGALSVAR